MPTTPAESGIGAACALAVGRAGVARTIRHLSWLPSGTPAHRCGHCLVAESTVRSLMTPRARGRRRHCGPPRGARRGRR
eukprot:363764-Chlamydomonas_euryale.AAC.7